MAMAGKFFIICLVVYFVVVVSCHPVKISPRSGNVKDGGQVKDLPGAPSSLKDMVSYAGRIPVNDSFDAKMFYWMFEPKNKDKTAPIIVWLQGGPGFSSLTGLFVENGPYQVNEDLSLSENMFSWNNKYHMLFLDNPCGAGFSTVKDGGRVTNELEVAQQLYTALQSFFKLYPQYSNLDLYIFGESYAGKFVPSIAHYILQQPDELNFKGIGVGNGFSDPIVQVQHYDHFAYENGLCALGNVPDIQRMQQATVDAINKGEYQTATQLWNNITLSIMIWAGMPDPADIRSYTFPHFEMVGKYCNQSIVREALYVPDVYFVTDDPKLQQSLADDEMQSVKSLFPAILSKIKVVLYNGQFDMTVTNTGADAWIRSIDWDGKECFATAPRTVWKTNKVTAGFVRNCKTLTQILVVGAGHQVPADAPEHSLDMVTRFVEDTPWAK